jgi:hypothetical protein
LLLAESSAYGYANAYPYGYSRAYIAHGHTQGSASARADGDSSAHHAVIFFGLLFVCVVAHLYAPLCMIG